MLETLHKLSAVFKSSSLPILFLAIFDASKRFSAFEETDDETPGDNFPYITRN